MEGAFDRSRRYPMDEMIFADASAPSRRDEAMESMAMIYTYNLNDVVKEAVIFPRCQV